MNANNRIDELQIAGVTTEIDEVIYDGLEVIPE